MALLARLTGPLQSWGAEPRVNTATTHPTPTWSAVRGLLRASLGHGRHDDPNEVRWLDDLTVAVRVDRPGSALLDYHTINPLPDSYEQFDEIAPSDRGIVPVGTTLQARSGQAPRWLSGSAPSVTTRHYLQDAAFLLLINSARQTDLERLADALAAPTWTLQLGRKSCTPDSPLLLGSNDQTILQAARTAPTMTPRPVKILDLVWIQGTADPHADPTGRARTVLDIPLGTHPQHGYATNQHTVTRVAVNQSTDPQVHTTPDEELGDELDPYGLTGPRTLSDSAEPAPAGTDAILAWARTHLTHPARSPQEATP